MIVVYRESDRLEKGRARLFYHPLWLSQAYYIAPPQPSGMMPNMPNERSTSITPVESNSAQRAYECYRDDEVDEGHPARSLREERLFTLCRCDATMEEWEPLSHPRP